MTRLLTAAAILAALTLTAHAESRSYYNAKGSYAGSSYTRGNSTSFYDSRGSYAGSSIRTGRR
jgi:hypothetical protein